MKLTLKPSFVIADMFRASTWTLKVKGGSVGFIKRLPYCTQGKIHLLDIEVYENRGNWEWSISPGHDKKLIRGTSESFSSSIKHILKTIADCCD